MKLLLTRELGQTIRTAFVSGSRDAIVGTIMAPLRDPGLAREEGVYLGIAEQALSAVIAIKVVDRDRGTGPISGGEVYEDVRDPVLLHGLSQSRTLDFADDLREGLTTYLSGLPGGVLGDTDSYAPGSAAYQTHRLAVALLQPVLETTRF